MSTSTRRPDSFEHDYRAHFDDQGHAERTFEEVLPAYRFGRTAALAPDTTGERFEAVEAKVRARYEVEHPTRSYAADRTAVRFGYERATQLKPGASADTLSDAPDAVREWNRSLHQHGDEGKTNVTSRNMAIRDPQQATGREGV